MSQSALQAATGEKIKQASSQAVSELADMRARVRDLTLSALQRWHFHRRGSSDGVRAVTQGFALGAEQCRPTCSARWPTPAAASTRRSRVRRKRARRGRASFPCSARRSAQCANCRACTRSALGPLDHVVAVFNCLWVIFGIWRSGIG